FHMLHSNGSYIDMGSSDTTLSTTVNVAQPHTRENANSNSGVRHDEDLSHRAVKLESEEYDDNNDKEPAQNVIVICASRRRAHELHKIFQKMAARSQTRRSRFERVYSEHEHAAHRTVKLPSQSAIPKIPMDLNLLNLTTKSMPSQVFDLSGKD